MQIKLYVKGDSDFTREVLITAILHIFAMESLKKSVRRGVDVLLEIASCCWKLSESSIGYVSSFNRAVAKYANLASALEAVSSRPITILLLKKRRFVKW